MHAGAKHIARTGTIAGPVSENAGRRPAIRPCERPQTTLTDHNGAGKCPFRKKAALGGRRTMPHIVPSASGI